MFLIVMSHYGTHGGFSFGNTFSFNHIMINIVSPLCGNIGVAGFIILSSYFLVSSTKLRFKSIIKIIIEATLVSVVSTIILFFFGNVSLSWEEWFHVCLPLLYGQYWFLSTYIVFSLLSPFVAFFLSKISKSLHLILVIILTIIWLIVPLCIPASGGTQLGNLPWFLYIFVLVGYFKKYPLKILSNKKALVLIGFIDILIVCLSIVVFTYLGTKIEIFGQHNGYLATRYSIFVLIPGLTMFYYFNSIKTRNYRFINLISSSMLGVYIIHESIYLRSFIWQDLFPNVDFQGSSLLIIHFIVKAMGVFISCICLSLIYEFTFNRLFDYLLSRVPKWYLRLKDRINSLDNVTDSQNE